MPGYRMIFQAFKVFDAASTVIEGVVTGTSDEPPVAGDSMASTAKHPKPFGLCNYIAFSLMD